MRLKCALLCLLFWYINTSGCSFAAPKQDVIDIFDHNGSVMLIIDSETGVIENANQAALSFYGYTFEELKAMTIQEINMLTGEEIKLEMSRAMDQERNYFNFEHRLKNGEIRSVEVYSYPFTSGEEKELLLSTIYDITPRLLAEKANTTNQLIITSLLFIILVIMGMVIMSISKSRREVQLTNKRLQSLFDNMQEGFALHEIVLNEEGFPTNYVFIDSNKAFENLTGLNKDAIKNKPVTEVLPGIETFWIEQYGNVAITEKPNHFIRFSKELNKYFSVSAYSPEKNKFATLFNDVTESQHLQQTLWLERNMTVTTLHSLSDGVISTDLNGTIEMMNPAAEQLTGWLKEEALGKNFHEVCCVVMPQICTNLLDEVIAAGETLKHENEVYLVSKIGMQIPVMMSIAPIKTDTSVIKGAVVIVRDFTEKKERESKIVYLSYHDQLTGLYNRRFFEEEMERLDTERNLPFSLAMIDVNGLKLTNDAFGHLAGDALLVNVAEILKAACRADDIIARIGGDEFVILLPKTDGKEAEEIVNRIILATQSQTETPVVLSVSIGIDTKLVPEQLMRDVFIKAEENMYHKKLVESQSMRNQSIQIILSTINNLSVWEEKHSQRVSKISLRIGELLELPYTILKELETTGLIHDIGKISVNKSILTKPDRLTDSEFEEIKKHSEIGYMILKSVDRYSSLSEYVLLHHERWDGKGYPKGLEGSAIPLISRVVAIAEAIDTMLFERPYRSTLNESEMLAELTRVSGSQFDPEIISKFDVRFSKALIEEVGKLYEMDLVTELSRSL